MEENKIIEEQLNEEAYISIPIKEYRKMIRKIERIKAEKKIGERIDELTKDAAQYRRWWKEEEKKVGELKVKLAKYEEVEE